MSSTVWWKPILLQQVHTRQIVWVVHVGVQQNSLLFSCQQFSNASITTSVDTTSQLLVVQLKRLPCNSHSCTYLLSDHSYRFQSFGGRSFKLDNYVSYPETIYLCEVPNAVCTSTCTCTCTCTCHHRDMDVYACRVLAIPLRVLICPRELPSVNKP